MKKLRVAVTGGSGRVGSRVVEALVRRGHKVVNLDRRQADRPLARFVYLDLARREQVQPVLEQVDAVCHLGEHPGSWGRSPEEIFAGNVAIGATVLQAAADLKLRRIVYTSTCQVYGTWGEHPVPPLSLPVAESHALRPQNTYALSKASNERLLELCARDRGVSAAIFRFPYVWTYDRGGPDETFSWLEELGGPQPEMGTYVHGSDAARAFVLALENPRPGCEAYHFSAEEIALPSPLGELLRKHHPDYPALPPRWPAFKSPLDCAKAKDHFGWKPAWNLLDRYRKARGHDPRPSPEAAAATRTRRPGRGRR
ncbi:MAG: NAD(P)-dependent oxidoreductase [Planctomycetota bacterium]|nr:NAD(P)-dependent oxidoreductase [Planctomycetota bacterium]